MNKLTLRRSAALTVTGLSVLAAGIVSAAPASAGVPGPSGLQASPTFSCSWWGGGDTMYYQCKVTDNNGIKRIVAVEGGETRTTNVAGCAKSATYTAFFVNTKPSSITVVDCKGVSYKHTP